jgi:hypothetical protein
VLGVGEHSTRMSSDTDRFSQMEEHPVDGQLIGNARLYVNTECISDTSHINTLQYCSVIAQKASPEQIEIVVVQLKDPKSFRPYILYTLNISEEYY